jgi:hypothetical protein
MKIQKIHHKIAYALYELYVNSYMKTESIKKNNTCSRGKLKNNIIYILPKNQNMPQNISQGTI